MNTRNDFETISINENKPMKGLTYDGEYLYSTVPYESAILTLDKGGSIIKRQSTRRPFCGICYDPAEKCFWAVCSQSPLYIYKLDKYLEEYGRIRLASQLTDPQTAIAYDEQHGGLLTIRGNHLLSVSETGNITSRMPLLAGTKSIATKGNYIITANKGAVYICNEYFRLKQCKYISDKIDSSGICVTDSDGFSMEIYMLSQDECYNHLHVLSVEIAPKPQETPQTKEDLNISQLKKEQSEQTDMQNTEHSQSVAFTQPQSFNITQPPVPSMPVNSSFADIMEQVLIDLINMFPDN